MKIKEVSGDNPGTTNVYQINRGDIVDIGGAGMISDKFQPANVEKVALTCSWIEHAENFEYVAKSIEPFDEVEVSKIYCPDPQNLLYGDPDKVVEIKDGDSISLSGYKFEVIIIEGQEFKEAMYYNQKNKILFAGDIIHILETKGNLTPHIEEAVNRLKELNLEDVYPAILSDNRETEDYTPQYIEELIEKFEKKEKHY